MLIVTTECVPGRAVADVLGLVVGQAVLSSSMLKSFRGGIRDVGSGRAPSYAADLEAARAQALADLTQAARAMGADAVLGLRMEHHTVGETHNLVLVTLMGTAARLDTLDLAASGPAGHPVALLDLPRANDDHDPA